ncbi:unnamed protein product [Musa banksii]
MRPGARSPRRPCLPFAASNPSSDAPPPRLPLPSPPPSPPPPPSVPLYVATKMASIRRSSFLVPSPETYARAALRWIGYEPRCTPYWPHSLVWCLLSVIPEFVIDQWRLSFCMNIRKRGQLKDAQKTLQ